MPDVRSAEETLDVRQDSVSAPAQELMDLWRQDRAPDLSNFLAQAGGLSRDQLVAVVRVDQCERWRRQERVPAEKYAELAPVREGGDDLLLDLVYSEFVLREGLGESPTLEEYVTRFPRLEGALRRLVAVHQALRSEVPPSSDPPDRGRLQSFALPPRPELPDLGKYQIVQTLGRGGQAVVYRAVHTALGKDVVIKLSLQPTAAEGQARDRLVLEGQRLAGLDHPNLAKVHDLDFYQNRAYLVMEYARGRNLEQVAAQETPGPRKAAALVAKLARALAVAHKQGIVHQDIKPKNVLVDEKGEPKLIDFGLARLQNAYGQDEPEPGMMSGTLAYMPPEQARGEDAAVSPRSDVFGLGGVLYFLLVGRGPYRGKDFADYLTKARAGDWDRVALQAAIAPTRLKAICTRALAADPARRHATAEELADDLERFLGGRRGWVIAAGALAAGALGLGLLGLLLGWWRPGTTERGSGTGPGSSPRAITKIEPQPVKVRVRRGSKALQLAHAVPLRTGVDQLQIETTVPPGLYVSLFHLSSEGNWSILTQKTPADGGELLRYPEANDVIGIEGKPGTEFVLVCGRRSGPVPLEDVRAWWGGEGALPLFEVSDVFQVKGRRVERGGRGFSPPRKGNDAEGEVLRRLDRFAGVLEERVDYASGVAFAHRENADE